MKLWNAFCSRIAIAISKRNECPCNDKKKIGRLNTSSLGSFNASHRIYTHFFRISFNFQSFVSTSYKIILEQREKKVKKNPKKKKRKKREWYLLAELLKRNALNACKTFATRFINLCPTHLCTACNLHAIRFFVFFVRLAILWPLRIECDVWSCQIVWSLRQNHFAIAAFWCLNV